MKIDLVSKKMIYNCYTMKFRTNERSEPVLVCLRATANCYSSGQRCPEILCMITFCKYCGQDDKNSHKILQHPSLE
jgi:hypothetical protein